MDRRDRLRRWTHATRQFTQPFTRPFTRRLPLGPRLGLSVTPERVGAVLVYGFAVAWSVLEAIGPEDTLVTTITRVLQQVRARVRPRWFRPGVWVAIDTPQAHVKTVRGLPPVTDARVIAQLLAATPERFFLGSTRGLVTTGVRVIAPGVVTAAAFESTMLDGIQAACAAMGLQATLFVPATVAMASVPPDDGPRQTSEILTAAHGATRVGRHEPHVARRGRPDVPSSPERHRGVIVAGVAAVASVSIAIATPVGLALQTSRSARHTIAALAPARANALTTEREVASMTAAITTVEAFEQHRLSKTVLLSQLTQALPAAATIATFTIDTTGATVVVLAPRAADVVRDLEELPGISQVEMLGPVTREVPPGSTPIGSATGSPASAELERVTVRFRLAAEGAAARRSLEGTE